MHFEKQLNTELLLSVLFVSSIFKFFTICMLSLLDNSEEIRDLDSDSDEVLQTSFLGFFFPLIKIKNIP